MAILSTLFLLARTVDPADAIPTAGVDVSERARDQQLTGPRFSGVSGEGTTFDLSAMAARPDPADPRRMSADAPRLVLVDPEGGNAIVAAQDAEVDTGRRSLILTGDVIIETSTGYALQTRRLEGTLGDLRVTAPGEVRGHGPLGTIRAGAMRIDDAAEGGARLLFTDGVELLYEPPDE
ncbi:MAG: LPS export ABC transporter periplasmic protein LptC [Pseudomonadota bacterium]